MKLRTDARYIERFDNRRVRKAYMGLCSLGFKFVLLENGGKKPKGWWKERDADGNKLDIVIGRSHLRGGFAS